jgi:hypothetical protein
MYLNEMGISIEDIYNELNARRWTVRSLNKQNEIFEQSSNEIIIRITTCKYTQKTDRFTEDKFGMKITHENIKLSFFY